MEKDWKCESDSIASFKSPTIQHSILQNKDVLHEGYRPKMLLYTLNELFYIYDQVKCHRGIDEKLVVAYEILSLTVLHCTECRGGSEKHSMPDALSLLNLNDACHLEPLTWVLYDGALLVGRQSELPEDRQWCTMLAGTFKHIYRGHDDAAYCPPYTLASGIVNRGLRCFTKREDGVLHRVATRTHPGPGEEDPGAAPGAIPGCQVIGIGTDTPAAPHPTCHQGATVGNPYPQA